ncbi:hypothetical protein HMI55_006737 [Coelomomyces lativittatus]|nr:hypothetical protein HMI56_003738 [Coelomomyces lativittatus]KAJ1511073.1 hypothetical protein HMI55_006737 [Coelomomyces lativittatus]
MNSQWRKLCKSIVPELNDYLHKGQCGRISLLGGCEEYTGSPFFAVHASIKLGVDLAHIICDINAGNVIKSYSPELIVYPYLRTRDSLKQYPADNSCIQTRVNSLLPRFHCLIAGPGMGRDDIMLQNAKVILEEAKKLELPMILDGDALYLLLLEPNLIHGYKNAILTPNHNEYNRLCQAVNLPFGAPVDSLAKAYGGVTIVQKGIQDNISDGDHSIVICNELGGKRRFGGQGDVLAGAIGCFITWQR